MSKILFGSWLLLLLFCLPSLAQDLAVSGRVTSSDDGSALPGVSVQVKGTTRGTTTDADGRYRLTAPANARLVFSFIGFLPQEVAVGNRSSVNIRLENNAQELGEVVVTGYGGSVNKREFTGASSKVNGKQFENMAVQTFDRALQGRAAGVQVTSANGVPGGAVQIRIRGLGSISAGSDPLYVVDGVQLNSNSNSSFTSNNPLAFLNPNDIESIEVLKDAAAASIYGSQAANGVVLVTTKRGKAGKTQINANYYTGVVQPLQYLNVLNTQQWIGVRTEALVNAGTAPTAALQNVLGTIRQPTDLTPEAIAALPTYDWQREAFRTGISHNAELSMNGGSEKTKFYLSGNYNYQQANLRNVDFSRGVINSTVTHTGNDKLTIEQKLTLSTITSQGQFGSPLGGSFLGAAAFSAPLVLPSNPIYNPDGSFFGTPALGGIAGILNQNIIQVSDLNDTRATVNQAIGGLAATYKVTKDLVIRPFVSLDYRTIKGRNWQDLRTADVVAVRGRIQDQLNQNTNFLTNITANYNKSVGSNDFGVLLGAEYRSEVNTNNLSVAENFPTPDFKYASAAANPINIFGAWTAFRRASLFGNLKYSYKKKYDISLIGRYDGSSRFGANNRYGFFPSASASWMVTEEDFLKGNAVLKDLKLRASYGITGNDQLGSLFAQNNFLSLGLFGAGFNYNNVAGMAPIQLANPNLRWETSATVNFGLDYSLFQGRINGAVDVFQRDSRDLLLAVNLPFTSGYSSIQQNAGAVRNQGLEIELNTVNFERNGFKWNTNFNVTFIRNEVTRLLDNITPLANPDSTRLINYTDFYGVGRQAILGKPLLPQYTSQYAGVNPATGRPMWYDFAGNITYNPLNPRDLRYLGTEQPSFFGGFTNTFSYKGISLDVFFQYEYGRRSFNGQTAFLSELGGRNFNTLTDVYNRRWVRPGDITDVPRPINGNAELRGASSFAGSRTLEDASYLRLKQITLSYDLPSSLLQRIKLRQVRVYGQALNMLTWTRWTGYDPEWLNFGSGNSGLIPNAKTFTFGVNIGL